MDKEYWKLYKLLLKDNPQESEAVIWLQGDRFDRAKNVLDVYKSDLAKWVVVSGNNVLVGPDPRAGEDNVALSEMVKYLLENGVKKDSIVVDDGALNTKDQAVHIMDLVKERRWKNIILVSSAYNQPRALLTFLKQMEASDLDIKIYNYPVMMEMQEIPGGRSESVEKLCLDEIEKIKRYENKGDSLPITRGINYMDKIK